MNINKYEGTMFSHCDSTLTDRMLEADRLVKKLEFLNDHLDTEVLDELASVLNELDRRLVEKCVTPRFKLVHESFNNPKDLFRSLLFHIKHVYREIYTAWVSGTSSYTPVFSDCMHEVDDRISEVMRSKHVYLQ